MTRTFWALGFCLALTPAAPAAPPQTARATKDPPGLTPYLAPYRAWFNAADADKDNFLDKEELARAFRGPRAKPYDYVAPPRTEAKDRPEKDKSDKDGPARDKDKSDQDRPEKDPGDTPEKKPAPEKPRRKPDYSRYADYNLLNQLDADGDERVSRAEFDKWAGDLAAQVKSQADLQKELLEVQLKLQREANRIKPQEKRRLEDRLRRQREQLNRLEDRIKKARKHYEQQHHPKKR